MYVNAGRISGQSVGEHCAVSQADAMAVLFAHGANDQALTNPLCRNRALDWAARISEWRTSSGHRLAYLEGTRHEKRLGGIPEQFNAEGAADR